MRYSESPVVLYLVMIPYKWRIFFMRGAIALHDGMILFVYFPLSVACRGVSKSAKYLSLEKEQVKGLPRIAARMG